jgi:hypothetical protein
MGANQHLNSPMLRTVGAAGNPNGIAAGLGEKCSISSGGRSAPTLPKPD